jgi:hypothetical protein
LRVSLLGFTWSASTIVISRSAPWSTTWFVGLGFGGYGLGFWFCRLPRVIYHQVYNVYHQVYNVYHQVYNVYEHGWGCTAVRGFGVSTRWTTNLSSKVNLSQIINFRDFSNANWSRNTPESGVTETLVAHRVVGLGIRFLDLDLEFGAWGLGWG